MSNRLPVGQVPDPTACGKTRKPSFRTESAEWCRFYFLAPMDSALTYNHCCEPFGICTYTSLSKQDPPLLSAHTHTNSPNSFLLRSSAIFSFFCFRTQRL